MMSGTQSDVANRLDVLVGVALKIPNPISNLLIMRSKIVIRGFKPFDQHDILTELGKLQSIIGEVHREMLRVEEIVKKNKEH